MKRIGIILMCILLAGLIQGCGGNGADNRQNAATNGVADVLESGMAAAAETEASVSEETTAEDITAQAADGAQIQQITNPSDTNQNTGLEMSDAEYAAMTGTEGVDVDLTVLSSTMVYSEVYNMMIAPEDYKGKVIKMDGLFEVYTDTQTGAQYYACLIQDATACCAQGIEFELEGEHTYPDDYPEPGEEVAVIGTFDTYMEGPYTYCTLRNASYAG